jgi:hypothetical protein
MYVIRAMMAVQVKMVLAPPDALVAASLLSDKERSTLVK